MSSAGTVARGDFRPGEAGSPRRLVLLSESAGLAAVLAGLLDPRDRLTRSTWSDEAAERARRTVVTFRDGPDGDPTRLGRDGFFWHFLDIRTGHRWPSSELSTMDSSILFAGMLSAAAWVKLVYERVTDESVQVLPGGSVMLQFSKLIASVPKNRLRTCAAAPPSTLCPESCSGIGGVVTNGAHVVSTSVFGLPSLSPSRIAVIGRQKFQ